MSALAFQSRFGFSPYFSASTALNLAADLPVSIPVWFSPCLDLPPVGERRLVVRFQSRSGFSPCFGVCWREPVLREASRFNPGLGFLPASVIELIRTAYRYLFQSRSGFSPCFGIPFRSALSGSAVFQSRSGFSPCFGPFERSPLIDVVGVSIPVWVFSLLRYVRPPVRVGLLVPFQSRSGFSPCFGRVIRRRRSVSSVSFNPGLGFLPASVPADARFAFNPHRVSIPVWVFSLLRCDPEGPRRQPAAVSIPVWVFSLLR